MKRYDGRTKPKSSKTNPKDPPPQQPTEYKCLIRASNDERKISTIISAKDVNKFQLVSQQLGTAFHFEPFNYLKNKFIINYIKSCI